MGPVMKFLARPKRLVRRGVLLGSALSAKTPGRADAIWSTPAVGAFLLHESPPSSTTALLDFIDTHRDHFADFSTVEERGSDAKTAPDRLELVLTFDDGLKSNLDIAQSLADRGLSACFYVVTDGIGLSPREADEFFRRRPMAQRSYQVSEPTLDWDDLEQMKDWGHVIGSHCRQHMPLSLMSLPEAEDQVKGSLAVLDKRLGDARHLAWPFGGLQHAPAADVVRWCREVDARAASGVRGLNFTRYGMDEGYLRRDAIDLSWVGSEFLAFFGRHSQVREAGRTKSLR